MTTIEELKDRIGFNVGEHRGAAAVLVNTDDFRAIEAEGFHLNEDVEQLFGIDLIHYADVPNGKFVVFYDPAIFDAYLTARIYGCNHESAMKEAGIMTYKGDS